MDSFTLRKIEFNAVRRILAGFCSCSLGKSLALRITPSRNPRIVDRWLSETAQMVDAVREIGPPPMGGVRDVTESLERAQPGKGGTGEDYAAIAATLEASGYVRNYLLELPEAMDRLTAHAEGIGDFQEEVAAIRAIVASDGTIRDDASPRLYELRRQIAALSHEIRDLIHSYLRRAEVAKLLQNPTVTVHGDRLVLPVKVENRGRLPGVVHRESNTGATVFVEPNACVELNNHLTDLHDDERAEVRRLLNNLGVKLLARSADIAKTLRQLAQVDLLAAKAQYAYQHDMQRPDISEQGTLMLPKVVHPLLLEQQHRAEKAGEEQPHQAVPIDVRLGQDFDLLVITGSNTGGKTVALKTVALMVVMAQSGLYLPTGRGAELPVFNDVFIDIGDEQSLQQSLSTFGAHIKRLNHILRKANKRSLILLDELGAGTDPEEGGAIGQAVLDELLRVGCLGMITTHLSVLKAYAYSTDRVDNGSVEFDTATLSPKYHLLIGMPGESHAITVAEKLGLPKRLISSARKRYAAQGKQFRKAIAATGDARRAAEAAREEAQSARVLADTRQEMYEAKLADLERLREEFATWLARLPEMKPGEEVYVPSMETKGRLERLQLHKQVAVVNVDRMQVEVPLRDLLPDLGQNEVRRQINDLRRQIVEQARQAEHAAAEAERTRKEHQQSLQRHRDQAKRFDQWLTAIARVKVGDEVPIALKPGRGQLIRMDLPALKATVLTGEGEVELSIQDLFPQTGPFAPPENKKGSGNRKRRQPKKDQPVDNRPVQHGPAQGAKAEKRRRSVLSTPPGEQVYVVPFQKRATLVRVIEDRDLVVVQSGVFEMELSVTDVEPVSDEPRKGGKGGKPKGRKGSKGGRKKPSEATTSG